MSLLSIFALVLAFFLSASALHWLIPLFSLYLSDSPNHRSSHSKVTPRGGGVVFVFISAIFCAFSLFVNDDPYALIPLLAVPLACIGFLDDLLCLNSFIRLVVQILSAFLILFIAPGFFGSDLIPSILFPVFIFAMVAVINFTNFMDGLDGLVSGCMVVIIGCFAIQASDSLTLWALVGSLLGFFVWNWSPAKIFMGDVGSTFLGAVFSGLVLQSSDWREASGILIVSTPLMADAFICVLRRFLAGQYVFKAHRLHLFQRLNQAGWSHANVSSLYISATVLLASALLLGGLPWVFGLAVFVILLGVWLDQRVALPFNTAFES